MDIFTQVQSSLEPYIRPRQEVDHIRRVLACQLDAQLDHSPGDPRAAALSLPHDSSSLKHSTGNIRGLRKEYLKSLRANIKARREYDALASSNGPLNGELVSSSRTGFLEKQGLASHMPDNNGYIDSYMALVKQRQRYERLRILQDCMDVLSRKSAASPSFLEEAIENGLSSLPRVPEDILIATDAGTLKSAQTNMEHLLHDLEKSVLQAKIRLNSDKQTLSQMKASLPEQSEQDPSATTEKVDTLEALGRTRNELIAWVEQELGRAGDSDFYGEEDGQPSSLDAARSIDQLLTQVRSQYNQYIKARQAFLSSAADRGDSKFPHELAPTENDWEAEPRETPGRSMRDLSPYLEELILVSNEQKSIIQQRSHLTVSLSKQHKEAVQLFDRLAEESHLLPSFPMPSSRSSRNGGQPHPLSNEISGAELASTAHRALAWTYAAESAATATMEAVLTSTEEGGLAIDGAHHALLDLEKLLGGNSTSIDSEEADIWLSAESSPSKHQNQAQAKPASLPYDIWASLEGQLGVIKRENHEPT